MTNFDVGINRFAILASMQENFERLILILH